MEKIDAKEMYRLYNEGEISLKELDEMRESLGKYPQSVLNAKLKARQRRDIIDQYKKGELSTSDFIAYETLKTLERNRKNTSALTTMIAIYFVLSVIGAFILYAYFDKL